MNVKIYAVTSLFSSASGKEVSRFFVWHNHRPSRVGALSPRFLGKNHHCLKMIQ